MLQRYVFKILLSVLLIYFAASYVYVGNPVIEEIGDYGSVGVNSMDPCNNPNIFC